MEDCTYLCFKDDYRVCVKKRNFYRLQEQMNIFNFTIHYKKGSEMPADFLSRNVCEAINVFDDQLPELQKQDPLCKHIRDFIQNLSNPQANQEPFKDPKANRNLMRFAQESFIQDDIPHQQGRGYTENSAFCTTGPS